MELTVEQALQQGVAAHKGGKLQDAERFYRAILQSDPGHPDANHNLGVLAVSVNKVDAALPLFKTALEASPNIEQFWLSYIDALIKEKQLDRAKQVLEQAKERGLGGEKIIALEKQLSPKTQIKNLDSASPSQQQLNSLLEYYQNGRFNDAEKLAVSITNDFPKHQFGWKVLGAVLGQTGRKSEAVDAKEKAIKLAPNDAESHNNLGNTLQELGRLDEAEASCRQAIALKPNYAEAHYNLGTTLQELGRLEDAEASYTQAVALRLDYVEAHNNLGITLQKLGKLDEAVASFRQTSALQPDYAEAHYNLGNTLKELGRLDEAEDSYNQAIALKSDFTEAHYNLGTMLQELGRLEEAIHHFDLGGFKGVPCSLECLYANKNYADLTSRIDSISELDPKNIRVAAVSAFVAHQMKKKDPYPYCANPFDFVLNKNLLEYDQNANNLMDEIIKEAENYTLRWESRTTKNGFQGSTDLFLNPSENIALLERIVLRAVDDYYDMFKHESNSLIKLWPERPKIYGWYNRLLKNGYQTAHIHPGGWLSGVIYVKTVGSFDTDEGAIEFSLHGSENLPVRDDSYPKKLHRPRRGDIILFPSSLFHRTIPFSQDTERCVVAFDVMPKN